MPHVNASRTKDPIYLANRANAFKNSDICWLCGQYVDPTIPFPDPWSKSSDHVIPVARGGSNHGPLMVSHLDCNRRRGLKPPPTRHARQWI